MHSLVRSLRATLLVALSAGLAHGRYAGAQTPARPYDEPLFTARDAAWAAGGAAASALLIFALDERIARSLNWRDSSSTGFRLAEEIAPNNEYRFFFASVGMYAVGRVFKRNRVADLGLHAVEAALLARLTTDIVAGAAGRTRPRRALDVGGDEEAQDFEWWAGWTVPGRHAFPSRHATGAYAFAAVLDKELDRWKGNDPWPRDALIYGIASLVGLGRMRTGHHWASDVASAAVIGVTSGVLVVRFNHRHPNNTVDRVLLGNSANRVGVRIPVQF